MTDSHADAHASHLRWLVFEFVLLLAGIYGAWRIYGGRPDGVWRAGLVAFTFLPTYFVLVTGQMGLLILLGFATTDFVVTMTPRQISSDQADALNQSIETIGPVEAFMVATKVAIAVSA